MAGGTSGLDLDCVFLNIGQHITSLSAGSLGHDGKDLLFVGTANNLLAYDVENNQDVFHKDVPDGATCHSPSVFCLGVRMWSVYEYLHSHRIIPNSLELT